MRSAFFVLLMLFTAAQCFGAEVYPNKPVRVILANAPGTTTDIVARMISRQLSEQLGKTFVIENRPGASGMIGTAMVAKSAPDGYTLSFIDGGFAMVPGLNKSLPYDAVKDFTPVSQIIGLPLVLVVQPSLNVTTLNEFIALAQENPGKFNYGSNGVGGVQHLFSELFKSAAKVNITHIPFSSGGSAAVVTAMRAGQVHMQITAVTNALPQVRAGNFRALAVTGKRLPAIPDVPSMAELGLPGMTVYSWTGLIGPAGIAKPIIVKLHGEVLKALAVASVKDWFTTQNAELVGSSPEQFSIHLRSELRRWAEVARAAGITPE